MLITVHPDGVREKLGLTLVDGWTELDWTELDWTKEQATYG